MAQRTHPTRRGALGAIGGGALLFALPDRAARAAPPRSLPTEDVLTEDAVLRDPDLYVAGNPEGDISIVAYSDYQCPYCRKAEPDLRKVVKDDGKIRLIFKDWPVLGPVSVTAARLALAAKFQDKYLPAHEALISATSRLTNDIVRERLAAAGVDVARATSDLESNKGKIDGILARTDAQAKAFGFSGTPAFIIGKFRVPGALTVAQFERAVSDARKAAALKRI